MGVVITRMTRPLRAWNIDNRAEKIINKEKPVAAPRRASTEAQLKLAQEGKINLNNKFLMISH